MALGIAFALGGGIGGLVKAFCEANPLPPLGMSVSKVDISNGDLNFGDLLKAIIKTKATELLLVVHGQLNGSGLFLPVAAGASKVTGKQLGVLMQLASSGKDPTDRQSAEFGADKKTIPQLIDLMNKVQAMNLKTVEWRACDLGSQPGVLKQFRDFFGASLMGAPLIANNFGIAGINIRPMDKIPDRFWSGFTPYYYPDKTNTKIIYFLKLDAGTGWPEEGAVFAEKSADLEIWIKTRINSKGKVPDHSIPMHHLWKEPDTTHTLDPATPILPLEPDYVKNIVYTRG